MQSNAHTAKPFVLIIESDVALADTLVSHFARESFRTQLITEGKNAMAVFTQIQPDMVVLNISMEGTDGLDLLKEMRANSQVPVVLLSDASNDLDKLVGFRLGADDYIAKPVNPVEVIARVRAILRRTMQVTYTTKPIRVGKLEINSEAHGAMVYIDNERKQSLMLTLTEYRLLARLASQPKRCFSRSDLIEQCLPESDALDRVIDSHLSKLRRKLRVAGCGEMIETIRGIGYRLGSDCT